MVLAGVIHLIFPRFHSNEGETTQVKLSILSLGTADFIHKLSSAPLVSGSRRGLIRSIDRGLMSVNHGSAVVQGEGRVLNRVMQKKKSEIDTYPLPTPTS